MGDAAFQRLGIQPQLHGGEAFRFIRRNVFLLGHAVEHVVAPFQVASRIIQGGKSVRVFDQGCDGGSLPGGQVRRLFAEVAQGSGADAIKSAAEVNAVQVKFQNLILAVPFRDAARQRYFHEFAAKAALIPGFGTVFQVIRISGKLLGDGGGALVGVPAVVDILPACPQNPQEVIARMFPETGIFLGNQRINHGGGDFVQRDVAAVLHINTAYFLPVPVINNAGFFQVIDAFQIKFRRPVVITFPDHHESEVSHGRADSRHHQAPQDQLSDKAPESFPGLCLGVPPFVGLHVPAGSL